MTINMLLCAATGRAAIIARKVRLAPESGRHLVALGMSLPSQKQTLALSVCHSIVTPKKSSDWTVHHTHFGAKLHGNGETIKQ